MSRSASRSARTRTVVGVVALVTIVAAGCSSSTSSAPAATTPATSSGTATTVAPTAAPSTVAAATTAVGANSTAAGGSTADIAIVDLAFTPATLTIKPGTTVRFTNNDSFGHTVTAKDNSYNSDTIAAGTSYTHRYDTAGSYEYRCTIHSRMSGTIVVAP